METCTRLRSLRLIFLVFEHEKNLVTQMIIFIHARQSLLVMVEVTAKKISELQLLNFEISPLGKQPSLHYFTDGRIQSFLHIPAIQRRLC